MELYYLKIFGILKQTAKIKPHLLKKLLLRLFLQMRFVYFELSYFLIFFTVGQLLQLPSPVWQGTSGV